MYLLAQLYFLVLLSRAGLWLLGPLPRAESPPSSTVSLSLAFSPGRLMGSQIGLLLPESSLGLLDPLITLSMCTTHHPLQEVNTKPE